MPKSVHRLTPYAAECAERIAASEGRKTAEFISNLIVDYARGLTFAREPGVHDRPDLSDLPAPHS
ncbi:MAG: hypothetical protein V4720_06295 [Pseudomonadota bacterium]